jgi:hypothetical protein
LFHPALDALDDVRVVEGDGDLLDPTEAQWRNRNGQTRSPDGLEVPEQHPEVGLI